MKTILVTGGAGFIGRHLVPGLLKEGYHVRILDTLSAQVHGQIPADVAWLQNSPGLEFQRGSVCSTTDLRRACDGADTVIHLAAETGTGQSMYEIGRYVDQNVLGTANLMQQLVDGSGSGVKRVILASSRAVYGEGAFIRAGDPHQRRLTPPTRGIGQLRHRQWELRCPETGEELTAVPTREDDRTDPASIYAATKLAQEDLVRIGCASKGVGFAILRLQNVYGEGQSLANPYTGLLTVFSNRIRRNLPLPVFEDGLESRDFVHVADVVSAITAACTREDAPNAVINVGSGAATPVKDMAHALSRAFGVEPRVEITGQFRVGDIRHNFADISRLRQLLGVTPHVSLEAGIERLVQWVKAQPLHEDRSAAANEELQRRKMMG